MQRIVRQVEAASHVKRYVADLVLATHPAAAAAPEMTRKYVRYGASPRGAQAIVLGSKIRGLLDARYHASFEDVMAIAKPARRHRIILNFEAAAAGVTTDKVIEELLKTVPKQTEEA
jgi:MoxR-like ATPase